MPALSYIVINLDPIALRLGPLAIHWYGLAYVLAIGVALLATLRYADDLGVPREHVWNIFLWAALAGLLGGRLYFDIQQPNFFHDYILHPINLIAVWNGGMAFFGAIFLAAPTAAILAWRAGLSPWLAFDMGALFAAVGQMFGRLGNLVNGDIVGYPVGGHPIILGNVCAASPCVAYVPDPHVMPWATVYLNHGSFLGDLGTPYQPSAAYEIVINLVALAILWPLRLILPQRVRAGAFFCLYVSFYAVGQFVIFFFRSNTYVPFLGIDGLKQAQWTAIFTLIAIALFFALIVRRFSAIWTFDRRHLAPKPYQPAAASPPTDSGMQSASGTAQTPPAAASDAAGGT